MLDLLDELEVSIRKLVDRCKGLKQENLELRSGNEDLRKRQEGSAELIEKSREKINYLKEEIEKLEYQINQIQEDRSDSDSNGSIITPSY